jgi:hypothetical protein
MGLTGSGSTHHVICLFRPERALENLHDVLVSSLHGIGVIRAEWTLLASESYVRGFSPYDREKKAWPFLSRFTASEIEDARKRAADLNRAEDGDTACFILRSL